MYSLWGLSCVCLDSWQPAPTPAPAIAALPDQPAPAAIAAILTAAPAPCVQLWDAVQCGDQGGALGSAMHGAVAAGEAAGGYATIVEATAHMAHLRDETYTPNPATKAVYDRLYAEYVTLHDYFGCGDNDVMKRLKALKAEMRG